MTIDSDNQDSLQKIVDLVAQAKTAGADAADAVFVAGASVSLAQRLGKPEHLSRSEYTDVGLRVFVGQRQAIVSSSDTAPEALKERDEGGVLLEEERTVKGLCPMRDRVVAAKRRRPHGNPCQRCHHRIHAKCRHVTLASGSSVVGADCGAGRS